MFKWRREAALDIYGLFLGAVLLASPWVFSMTRETARVDTWISGAMLLAVSAAAILAFAQWEVWISLLVGLWMIVSPFALGFEHTAAMHLNIGIGCAVVFFALLELWLVRYEHAEQPSEEQRRVSGH